MADEQRAAARVATAPGTLALVTGARDAAPHLDLEPTEPMLDAEPAARIIPRRAPKLWRPKRVLVTPAALASPLGRRTAERAAAVGAEVVELAANRLTGLRGATDRETYARAKSTLALVVAPPSRRRLQPIPPSADWRVDLAEGCPAHCQYCYLAGSLSGPPVTRVYANLPEILDGLASYVQDDPDPAALRRPQEGTTFESSCYTDPLATEHLTGSVADTITHFGAWDADVQLRFTTKYDAVDGLLGLDHGGRTRIRFSVNAAAVSERFEGGTAAVADRLSALRRCADAGYPVGLTIAPIIPVPDWQQQYGALLLNASAALSGAVALDLTVEMITHRFTPGSRDVLLGWYPRTRLEMDVDRRSAKRNKFGGVKYVFPRDVMARMRGWFTDAVAEHLPTARILYWT